MKVVNNEDTRKFLQARVVQERVHKHVLEARLWPIVSISVAANLSGFTESQLREWDEKGLLQAKRNARASEGRSLRQYTSHDLDKLALLKELMSDGYSINGMRQNIDFIWKQVAGNPVSEQQSRVAESGQEIHLAHEVKLYSIDIKVDQADVENFWRYFALQALRLTLLLITEDMPGTTVGLILPLERRGLSPRFISPNEIAQAGSTLIWWLGTSRAMFTNCDPRRLTCRAYRIGYIIYRTHLTPKVALLVYRNAKGPSQSAIAILLSSTDGMVTGAIPIAWHEAEVFTLADKRAPCLITRMLEELLAAYQKRAFVSGELSEATARPKVVDAFSADYLSEEDFINEFESLLTSILKQEDKKELEGREVSFIVIDIDNQSPLSTTYRARAVRNLSRNVSLRLQRQMQLQSNPDYRNVYHVGADRYYLKLVGMPLDDARNLAKQIHILLKDDHRANVWRAGALFSPPNMLILQNVIVHLGVSKYLFTKLREILERLSEQHAMVETRTLLLSNFEQALKISRAEGGDCVISWDYKVWTYSHWSPDGSTLAS